MKRFFAQRPLPSITMATWRGMGTWLSTEALSDREVGGRSDGQDLGFLGCDEAVDLGDRAVGQSLELFLGERRSSSSLISLSLSSFFACSLASRRRLRAAIRASSAGVAHDLGQVLAALFGQREASAPAAGRLARTG